jgi:hypothetical protein|tara:strand:- start:59 stop:199 length:141 start_codon:yes stop_codon:yes gene_type:complete
MGARRRNIARKLNSNQQRNRRIQLLQRKCGLSAEPAEIAKPEIKKL